VWARDELVIEERVRRRFGVGDVIDLRTGPLALMRRLPECVIAVVVSMRRSSMLGCGSSEEVGLLSVLDGRVARAREVELVEDLVSVLVAVNPRKTSAIVARPQGHIYSLSDLEDVCELHQFSVGHCLPPTQV